MFASRALHVQLACTWEALARKPGNVHRFTDFHDLTLVDFLTSAAAIAPILATANQRPLGDTVLHAVLATHQVVSTNANLGIILLLAPLCTIPKTESLESELPEMLEQLTIEDSRKVYQAMRLANPSGMGESAEQDLRNEPTLPLRQIMSLAADRDLIARQYSNGFHEVFHDGVRALESGLSQFGSLEAGIIYCHLGIMSRHPDSLIARKCGQKEADIAAEKAGSVLHAIDKRGKVDLRDLAEFDNWLRADGHKRNPGTTADLVAASLFVALQTGKITLPLAMPWSAG